MNYDQFMAALCLWREARGCSLPTLAAVYQVILNRSTDAQRRFPRTLAGVVLQHMQFSSFNVDDPNSTKFPMPPAPGAQPTSDWKAWLDCQMVVQSPIGGDSTGGATNYEDCADDKLPAWAQPDKLTATIGPFRFYKL